MREWLDPMALAGETLRFDLSTHRSALTRQLLQVRVRLTARVLGAGDGLVPANLAPGALEVEAGALLGANATVRERLEAGPDEAVAQLRRLAAAGRAAGRRARFERRVEACATMQALGALKFCLPASLRPRLAAMVDDVDALVAPDGPTVWSRMRRREVALAGMRGGPGYGPALDRHRRDYGFLLAEDVDFREASTAAALDARLAGLAADDERGRLDAALARDRAAKINARNQFAAAEPDVTLVSHVLLARALTEHEDRNRAAKMRFLRDACELAESHGLDPEWVTLDELAKVG
ncbi:MAG TPA: hypothetical protein VFJ85_03810 [Acidimicrobiales bacterium]|nr:hypothetical protein [Acidimicrobiales bacterium]